MGPEESPVLIAGGTGFIGSGIARDLVGRRPIVVLTRDAERARRRSIGAPAAFREGDVTRPETLAAPLEGVDTVVQCVQFPGFPVEAPGRGRTFVHVDAHGTEALVSAAREAGVRKFVYLSGVGADPLSDRPWFRAKGLAEQAVASSGLTFVIVRPSWTFGPGDSSLNRFAELIRLVPFVFPQIGAGEQRINPVFIDDVARLVTDAVDGDTADGATLEIGGRDVLTIDEIIQATMRVLDRVKPIVHVPVGCARAGARGLELLPGQLLSRGAVDFITQSAIADLGELDRRFPGFELAGFEAAIASYMHPR
jgi:NADH dehydrogenase